MGVGALERAVGRLPKYGRIFVRLAALSEKVFRAFDDRRLRTFIGARSIPPLALREGGHQAYTDWCFQSGVYAGLLASLGRSPLRVLDVGCGAGEIVAGVLQALSDDSTYLGVDIDDRLVERCGRTYRDPRARFAVIAGLSPYYGAGRTSQGDALAVICGERQWDVIILKAVFDHLSPKDAETYLHDCARGLAPEGVVIATFFVLGRASCAGQDSSRDVRFRFDDAYPGHPGFRYSAAFNTVPEAQLAIEEERLDALLDAAGLEMLRALPGTWHDRQGGRGLDMPDTLVLTRRRAR